MSVDPGAVHVGVAFWWGPYLNNAEEMTPNRYVDSVALLLFQKRLDRVVMEGFWLRPAQAKQQSGSSFGQVELIGWTRHECRRNGVPFFVTNPSDTDATVKRYRAANAKIGHGKGPHVRDAIAVLLGFDRVKTADYLEKNP